MMNTQKRAEGVSGQNLIQFWGKQGTNLMLNDLWSVYVKLASLNENVAKGERKNS